MPRSSVVIPAAVFLSLVPLAGAVRAQTPTPPPGPDLTLLKRALAPLAGDGLLQSLSTLQITGSKQGVSFTFQEKARVVAKRPGKFRTYVTQFAADGTPERRLIVISDGKKVWTYRPGTRQYCVTSSRAFRAADSDMTALGLVQGGFFLGEGHEMAQGFGAITQGNASQVLTMLNGMGIHVTCQADASGSGETVYRMVLTRQGITYKFFVNSATARLRQVELSGRQDAVNVLFRETIEEMKAPGMVAKTTFAFTPPPGSVRVSTLSVDPF